MRSFPNRYFFVAIILFVIEVFIAVFVDDQFVRPSLGDFLVVIMLYCFVRAFLNISRARVAIAVLLFAYCIEITQYFHLVELLHWQHSKIARAILGSSFAWSDLLAYTLGISTAVLLDTARK